MKNNRLIIPLFLCLFAVQISVPLYMIVSRERTLSSGRLYKFLTAPVDPYDAFRGKYVALRFQQESVPAPNNTKFDPGQKVYVSISEGENGFTKIIDVSKERPKEGDYIKAKVRYTSGKDVYLDLPFDRYYMNEEEAPLAETAYREHSRTNKQDAYVLVRVRNGSSVIEKLYIDGKPISEFLKDYK